MAAPSVDHRMPISDEGAELEGLGWPSSVTNQALMEGSEEYEDEGGPTEQSGLLDPADVERDSRPWYRRPSPWWLMPGSMLMAISMGATMAPKIEIYNLLVCRSLDVAQQQPIFGTHPTSLPRLSTTPALRSPTLRSPEQGDRFDQFFDTSATPSPATEDGTVGIDPKMCRTNTKVQRAVAQLVVTLAIAMGTLSAFTTSYWGGYSDRTGRRRIIAISLTGFVMSDLIFITVVRNYERLNYRWLVLAPTIDGLLGGFATASAAFGAYLSDSTPAGSRARIFSILMGTIFAGISVGPTLGALVIKVAGTPIAPFYASATMSTLNVVFVLVALPESLSKERRQLAQENWEALRKSASEAGPQAMGARIKSWFAFLQPMTMFFPRRHTLDDVINVGGSIEEEDRTALVAGRVAGKRYWTLTCIALAYASYVSIMGIYSVKMQYAQFRFSWGPEENSLLLTVIGISRVIALVVVLPLGIKLFKRQAPKLEGTTRSGKEESLHRMNRRSRMLYDAHFDLSLARLSFAVDLASFAALTVISTPAAYVIATAAMSGGSGASPAMQSLALSLSSPSDAGKVLAGLGVISSIMSSIVGPLMYGTVYAITIDVFPTAIFVLGSVTFILAFVALAFVRFPSRSQHTRDSFSVLSQQEAEALRRGVSKSRGRDGSKRDLRRSSLTAFADDSEVSVNVRDE